MYVPKSRGILFQNRGLILGPFNITTGGCASKEGFLVALAAAAAPAVIFFLKQMTIEFVLKLKKKKKKKIVLMYVPKSRGILFQNRGLILGPLNITTRGCASKEGFPVALAAAPAVILFLKRMTIEFVLKLKKKKSKSFGVCTKEPRNSVSK